jgi:hypothetical protein
MTERPIPFKGEMVRAILDGRKTQTRRVMKVQPYPDSIVTVEHFYQTVIDRHGDMQPGKETFGAHWDDGEYGLKSPYGAPGDLLWVREKCKAEELSRPPTTRTATAKERRLTGRTQILILDDLDGVDGVRYDADNEWRRIKNTQSACDAWTELYHYNWHQKYERLGGWVPSIHMPRWASRITLRITDVRVERLQDISEEDAEAEGLTKEIAPNGHVTWHVPDLLGAQTPCRAFRLLWENINGAGAWDANQWVWAISFERVKP